MDSNERATGSAMDQEVVLAGVWKTRGAAWCVSFLRGTSSVVVVAVGWSLIDSVAVVDRRIAG